MKTVVSFGVFDILHAGHLNVLTQASILGQKLIVGIMGDEDVESTKGRKPVLETRERKKQLESLPFVSEVIIYRNIPEELKRIQPDIIVQGDDWLQSADRTEALEIIKDRGIRLILLPRTEGISTTEIRKRITDGVIRNDADALQKHLTVYAMDAIDRYEAYDPEKVDALVKKILLDSYFSEPVLIGNTIAHIGTSEFRSAHILVDGANRFEAMKRIGANFMPSLAFDYDEIELDANVHFKQKDGSIKRLSEFSTQEGERIDFPRRTRRDIVNTILYGDTIQSGETWHKPPFYVTHFKVPLHLLVAEDTMDNHATVQEFIENKIANTKNIRFIPKNVYVCDEWNDTVS